MSSQWNRFRRTVWELLDTPDLEDRHFELSTAVNVFIFTLIVLNVLATVAGTVESVRQDIGPELRLFEIFSVIVFTVEYVLRIWSCPEDDAYPDSIRGRLQFVATAPAIIDLLAVLPFYLTLGFDFRFIRVLRLLRVFRLAKAARYFPALRLFARALREKKEELVVTLCFLSVLLVLASSFIYYAERGAQPDAFGSVPEALWWSVVTITTVGYGDAYPVTTLGRILGGCVALLGTGLGAVPAGLLASGFSDALADRRKASAPAPPKFSLNYCPSCGEELPHEHVETSAEPSAKSSQAA